MNQFLRFYLWLDSGILTWSLLKICFVVTVLHAVFAMIGRGTERRYAISTAFWGVGLLCVGFSLRADFLSARITAVQDSYREIQIAEMDAESRDILKIRVDQALQGFRELVDEGHRDREVTYPFALLLLRTGQATGAIEFLRDEIAAGRDGPDFRVVLGRALVKTGRIREGVQEAERLLDQPGGDELTQWAFKTAIEGYLALDEEEAAARIFQKQLKTMDGRPDAQELLNRYFAGLKAGRLQKGSSASEAPRQGAGR